MLAAPAAICVLDLLQQPVHLVVPGCPFIASGDDHRFAGQQEADEFLAAIVAKPAQQLFIAQAADLGFVLHLGSGQATGHGRSEARSLQRLFADLGVLADFAFPFGLFQNLVRGAGIDRVATLSAREGVQFHTRPLGGVHASRFDVKVFLLIITGLPQATTVDPGPSRLGQFQGGLPGGRLQHGCPTTPHIPAAVPFLATLQLFHALGQGHLDA